MLMMIVGGVSAAISKTAAAPIERVKLLIQNQVRLSALSLRTKFARNIPKEPMNNPLQNEEQGYQLPAQFID